jgi:hypothetical protein
MTTIIDPAATGNPRRREERHTLAELAEELLRQQETKRDYVVDTRRMTFSSYPQPGERGGSYLSWDTADEIEGGFVKERAHRQIGERVGIPRRYYTRMQQEAPGLLDANVGHWLREKPERRMVRMLGGDVRAFLSDRYRRLDNIDLLEQAIVPVFSGYPDLEFQVSALTDDRMYVRALLPSVQRDIRPGDTLQAGVEIRNSEVGESALAVQPFAWRLVCANGMIVPMRALTRYHVGRAQEEEAYAIYRDDTLAADDAAFFLKVRDAVGAALSETFFSELVEELQAATTGPRVQNPVAATERLAQRFDLNEQEQMSVLRHLALGGDLNQWGLANAVTAAAKEADMFERQRDMEVAGGLLVSLPAQEWAGIASP